MPGVKVTRKPAKKKVAGRASRKKQTAAATAGKAPVNRAVSTRRKTAKRTPTKALAAEALPRAQVAGKTAGISDAAVQKATGRTWPQWFATLDAAGCRGMDHKQIAQLVYEKFGVAPWWGQMVTVGYEQGVLGREKHSKGRHYEVGASRTVNVPVAAAFEAWIDPRTRGRWLPGADLVIRKATPHKSMRITWDAANGASATNVDVGFWEKGPAKCMVQVGHGKITSARAGERLKAMWGERLDALRTLLER